MQLLVNGLLDTLSLSGLLISFFLILSGFTKQNSGAFQQLIFPLAHLNRVIGVVGSDLLEGPATGNGFHGYTGLELGTVGSALGHPPCTGGAPPQRLTMALVQKTPTLSDPLILLKMKVADKARRPG